jgi:hypothetical protein
MRQPLCRRPAAFGAASSVLCSLIAASVAMAASTPSTPPLEEVLRRTGKAVEAFEQEFSAINCTEQVSQVKLGPAGKPLFHQESAFDYLVMVRSAPDNLTVEESRQEVKSTGEAKKKLPLLVTDGFSTLLLIFHPFFQDSFEYAPPEADELNGRKVLRVRFRQIHGARALSELQLRGHDFPLEWQGTAWIDARTNVILRITAGLQGGMDDVGLRSLDADVSYAAVRFAGDPAEHWLPDTATVEAQTPRQHWRNIHRFTNYKRFTVDTKETVASAQ